MVSRRPSSGDLQLSDSLWHGFSTILWIEGVVLLDVVQ
jgi:hypothetical protein